MATTPPPLPSQVGTNENLGGAFFIYTLGFGSTPTPSPVSNLDRRLIKRETGQGAGMEPNHNVYVKSTTVYVPSSELGLSHPLLSPESVPLPPERGCFRRQHNKLSTLSTMIAESFRNKFDPVRDFFQHKHSSSFWYRTFSLSPFTFCVAEPVSLNVSIG